MEKMSARGAAVPIAVDVVCGKRFDAGEPLVESLTRHALVAQLSHYLLKTVRLKYPDACPYNGKQRSHRRKQRGQYSHGKASRDHISRSFDGIERFVVHR